MYSSMPYGGLPAYGTTVIRLGQTLLVRPLCLPSLLKNSRAVVTIQRQSKGTSSTSWTAVADAMLADEFILKLTFSSRQTDVSTANSKDSTKQIYWYSNTAHVQELRL